MEWMAWTLPTGIFFIVIFIMLACMTIWEILSPTVERRGFLPMSTTRGDRLFIGLLGSAYIHLAWMTVTEISIWNALVISIIYLIVVMRFG
ncbi:MAG: hypothetical protein B6245_10055 [Desulfobacteraceae bacterium 4572_88]|nr:MAG: hypothetical protein B6245_10055 [Desulfobacteraceae bacterium 4572_88]